MLGLLKVLFNTFEVEGEISSFECDPSGKVVVSFRVRLDFPRGVVSSDELSCDVAVPELFTAGFLSMASQSPPNSAGMKLKKHRMTIMTLIGRKLDNDHGPNARA